MKEGKNELIEKGRFGVGEATCLISLTLIARVFYTSPALAAQKVGNTLWYMSVISTIAAIGMFIPIYILLKRHPDKNILEIYDMVTGPIIGSIFSSILFISIAFSIVLNIREFTDVLNIFILPTTPKEFMVGLFIISVVVASFLGLEPIARFSKLFFYALIVGLVSVTVLASKNFHYHYLFPIGGYGVDKTIVNGFKWTVAYREIILLGLFAPCLQGTKYVKKAGYRAIIITGAVFFIGFCTINLSFPYGVVQEITAPLYIIASLIDYGRFFQRLESIFVLTWNLCTLISVAVSFYGAINVYCHIFKIEDKKPIILPFAVFIFSLVLMPESFSIIINKLLPVLLNYGWIVYFMPPFIALISDMIFKTKGRSKNA